MKLRTTLALAFSIAHLSPLVAQAAWTRLYPSAAPGPRVDCASAFDSVRGRTMVFGGIPQQGPVLDELWLWDGTGWIASAAAVRPPARYASAMAFDEFRGRAVLFGGRDAGGMSDTWEWNGSAWSQVTAGTRPSARSYHSMAYDPMRRVVLLFGGYDTNQGTFFGDLWQWDGQTWQSRNAVGPSGRYDAAMAFDPNRGEMLLFGGGNATQLFDETWAWNGVNWQRLFPATPPYPRGSTAMVTDTARSRVVMLGSDPLQDPFAWEWDGTNWHPQVITSPAARRNVALAYDSVRREVVLFGGGLTVSSVSLLMNDTWIYRTSHPASATPYGQGCPGSAGIPTLNAAPYSLPWLGDTFRTRLASVPTIAGTVFVTGIAATPGQSLSSLGFPGCQSFVTLDSARFVLASGGVADWSLAVPADPALISVSLFQQCFVLDAGAPGGAVVSNALSFTAGVR